MTPRLRYEQCMNPIVDILVLEVGSTLMLDFTYTLTKEGERVLAYLGEGPLAFAQPELMALKSLATCGGNILQEVHLFISIIYPLRKG